MVDEASAPRDPKSGRFGTFGGVFTPSLLTILGVIMFLRFSTVVGQAGLWNTLLILAGAKAISLVTGLSIASIATNMRVKGGGAYYLISRSLGVEFGGVIAVFFYIAQAVAVTMYIVGFTEALFSAFPRIPLPFRDIATFTNLIVFVCVYIGAGWTIRLQYGILAVLLLSVVSFLVGGILGFSPEILRANLAPEWTPAYSFFTVFALFFPAVTGIMAGVNMSGDLRDASRSIPRGTFASVGVATLIYLVIAFLLAASVSRAELLGDGFVMKEHAFIPALIYAGVISATLSSALGSMMGAPRILQAFARDKVFRPLRWFGRGSQCRDEPRRAIVLTFLIAQVGILAGDLDTVAPVITMFFLMTYGTVNLACFYEGRSNNPSFRPTFRLNHWSVALFGAIGCLGVMFLINAVWAAVSIVLAGTLYFFIARSEVQVKWGDVDSGLAYQRARKALLRLERERYHPKNWRPSVLVLAGGAKNRLHLCEYASWFTTDRGIVSIAQVIRGELEDLLDRRREAENILRKSILEADIPAFPVVVVEEDIHAAIKALLQCHGIGGMRPNTVMLGWSEDPENLGVFSETLAITKRMKRSLIIIACQQEQEKTYIPDGAINVWWTSQKNGALMLLLAYLLTRNNEWRDRPLRIIRPVAPKADIQNIEKEMGEQLSLARIEAELVIVPTETALDAVRIAMQPSAVLFVGFELPDEDSDPFIPQFQPIVDLPGDVILVYNAGDVSLDA
ncbi:MAG: amino acid permease [Sedimentisphaerales bacterium]|nr:amino acid permease [Planctomycetota bacterium]MDY0354652.1 amino acid permease [Sedimentisphaerales bacterium]NLT77418.1 amino acid permease [Planctomycetota bacterium]